MASINRMMMRCQDCGQDRLDRSVPLLTGGCSCFTQVE